MNTEQIFCLPAFIHIYDGGMAKTLYTNEIAEYLEEKVAARVDVRENLFSHYLSSISAEQREETVDTLARKLATARVRNLTNLNAHFSPMYGEIEYEKRRLNNPQRQPVGVLYDGFSLSSMFYELLPSEERTFKHLHIVFTNQLFGTWDENDGRYHARVSIYSFPSLISTTGIVEAPAKPRDFYLLKQQYAAIGMKDATTLDLKQRFSGRFIDYDDERLTEVMKGYVMQALFFHITGEPFCEDKNCRLYNAHWQEEVINAQLKSEYEFCEFHQDVIG